MDKNTSTEKEKQNSFINELVRNWELLEELRDKARIADLWVIVQEYHTNDDSDYKKSLDEETVIQLEEEIDTLKSKKYWDITDKGILTTTGAENDTDDLVDLIRMKWFENYLPTAKESQ